MNNTKNYSTFTKCENARLYKVIEYESGARVEIPISHAGAVVWYEDKMKNHIENIM